MIDTDKYEGHTEGPWQPLFNGTADSNGRASTIETQATHPPYGNKILITEIHSQPCLADPLQDCEANAQLIADAPLLLAEVKRLTKFRDRVLAAFVEMPRNGRSLTYLLDELGYLNHYSRADYLEGLHPHALGLFELKDEWMEKAQQYLGDE